MSSEAELRAQAEALREVARQVSLEPDKARLNAMAALFEARAERAAIEERRSWKPPD